MPWSLPLSPQLEYVKQTQIQAQEQRVNARVQEWMERRSLTPVISRRIEGQVDASTRSDAVGSSSRALCLARQNERTLPSDDQEVG